MTLSSGSVTIRKDLTCGSIGRHARLGGSFVAAVLEADNLVTFSQLFGREVSFVLVSHFDSDGGSDEALLLSLNWINWFKCGIGFYF